MVKNPPCNTGDTGSMPGWETKIPHAAEQLSKPTGHNYRACLPQLEYLCAPTKDPACQS